MTREEAIKRIKIIMDEEYLSENNIALNLLVELIDEIYNDFESKVCKNCFYYEDGICCCDKSPLVAEAVDENFGCNKFEKREDERN